MIKTTVTLGFQKLAGFFYSGLGATYTTTVTPGTGVIENFNVLKRPVSSVTSSVIGNGGASGTVIYTENSDIEFELEVWGNVVTVGTFTISSTSTGTGQGSMLASYATDLNGNITGLVGSDGVVIPLPLQYKAGGTPALPVSTFDGASSSGAFGLPERILIPANSISNGSRLRLSTHIGKTGAGTAFIQMHFGQLDSLSDANLLDGNSPQFTTLTPSKWLLSIDVTFGDTSANATWQRNSLNVGMGAGFPAEKTGLDFTVDNYINIGITGAAAGSTYTLIEYHLELFR